MKKGLLIVFSGPSGVGKGTILNEIFKCKSLKLCFSISMTTRKSRKGEKNGREYFFVTKKEFKKAIKDKELIEYCKYVDNFYGTPKKYVEEMRNKGYNVVLDIETNGAKNIQKKYKDDVVSIYIIPPSIKELEKRLFERGSESEEEIKKRIAKTKRQLKNISMFSYIVENNDLKEACNNVKNIIKKEIDLKKRSSN